MARETAIVCVTVSYDPDKTDLDAIVAALELTECGDPPRYAQSDEMEIIDARIADQEEQDETSILRVR